MDYDYKFIDDRYWINPKTKQPWECLIEGDTSTKINLGWFTQDFKLTDKGVEAYKTLLKNNGR